MGMPGSRRRDDEHYEPQKDYGPAWLACCRERREEAVLLAALQQEVWNRQAKFESLMKMQEMVESKKARGLVNLYERAYDLLKSLAEQVRA